MSKIIKYNDYVQIAPDKRILSLDKKEKVELIDNMLERSFSGGKGLVITYDLSHSGRRINNRIYSTKGQQRGIDSLTNPYPKPILKNHDQSGEPIGRFIGGEWQNLYDDAKEFLQSSQAVLDIHSAFAGDDPEKIYDTLKAMNLIENKQWPGLGRMRVQANITDEEAIKKFMDGRYLTFSAGSTTDRHVCSICKTDWARDGMCEHRHGKTYDGEICVFITGEFLVMEGSVVNTPADDLSQLVHMEMRDSEDATEVITDKEIYIDEFIMTDSVYIIGDKNELQATQQIDAYKEETEKEAKEKVEKKFDHQMSISESAMMDLHQKGETYITQRGDNETMVIKVTYSGKMRSKDENSFVEEYVELEELVEELLDEKSFKVPSGAKGNAQKVLNWKKEKGSEVKGMTPVGWARARQLATKSEIGLSTVKRMASFNRHRKNAAVDPKFKSEPWKDRGYVAWLGWGGTSGIDWAVRVSAANDSLYTGISEEDKESFTRPLNEMIGDFDLDAYKSSPKGKGAKTPAKPSERVKGSKKNKEGSASKANSEISVGSVLESLKEKASSHNKKHGKEKGKRVTLGMLKAVYRRGAGAFSSTHRPGMSRSGWGVARVNAFLKLVRSGRPSNPKYKQDNDLLPADHPRKSSNKPVPKKDFSMNEKETTESLVKETFDSDRDQDLEIEAVEPTEEQQTQHDESFEEHEEEETQDPPPIPPVEEDLSDEEWEFLDLALQGALANEDASLSAEERKNLPDSAFCGPNRSFPVNDCTHVTAAMRMISKYKASDEAKGKIMSCIRSKSSKMGCDKSKDHLDLEEKFDNLQKQYEELEDKFKTVLESIIANNSKKTQDEVEKEIADKVIDNNKTLLDNKVESPSEHIQDENISQKKEQKLPAFEQNIVDTFKQIKNADGEYAATLYIQSKAQYLPRGFNPNKF